MSEVDVRLRGVTKRFDSFVAVDNIDLEIRQGEFVTLLGPSGCGKTTTLRMIGGFEIPDEGAIEVGGELLDGSSSNSLTRMVFQSYALFPHMPVFENVAFGLKMARLPADRIRKECNQIIEKLGLEAHASKFPKQLSGGQQQRVALARALVTRPKVLLLDEPLGALDLKMRKRMQVELKNLQKDVGITFIYVTHDQEEAMNLSDSIVVMDRGRIVQSGGPEDIYLKPSSPYVADFIGETNLLSGASGGMEGDRVRVTTKLGSFLAMPSSGLQAGTGRNVVLAVRPERVEVLPSGKSVAAGQPELTGTVVERSFLGAVTRLTVNCKGVFLNADHWGRLKVSKGDTINLTWSENDLIALGPDDTKAESVPNDETADPSEKTEGML